MNNYTAYDITMRIPFEDGDEILERVKRLADKNGSTVEREIEFLIMCGLNYHMETNLDRFFKDV